MSADSDRKIANHVINIHRFFEGNVQESGGREEGLFGNFADISGGEVTTEMGENSDATSPVFQKYEVKKNYLKKKLFIFFYTKINIYYFLQ